MSVAVRFLFAVVLWLAACVGIAQDLPRAKPEDVGLSSARLENILKVSPPSTLAARCTFRDSMGAGACSARFAAAARARPPR